MDSIDDRRRCRRGTGGVPQPSPHNPRATRRGKWTRPNRRSDIQSDKPLSFAVPEQRAVRRVAPPPCLRGKRAGRSLNDFIRPPQERRRDRQAKGLRGLEVDNQLELGGLLNGQVARFGAFEDLVRVAGYAPGLDELVGAIGHKTSGLRMPPKPI